ncbi:hypothetical protein BJ741DRAFT_612024 [Chytriomyces cf. hyalinus JEL632]|nr:hypothetical protein BJ741DRAFT_612024 [Chytriomyces cf. hyalinus JEL632]
MLSVAPATVSPSLACPILCATPGCDKAFDSKDARKEHQFQYHSSPRIRFRDRSEPQFIKRDFDGFLRCSCSTYKVLTVGGMKRHAKKCSGMPRTCVTNPQDLPFYCVVDACEKRYKTKNALAVHVYEYHSSPKIRFIGKTTATVMQRASDGYLNCPCGSYRVITTAAMLKHIKGCDGEPKCIIPTPPDTKFEFDWTCFNLPLPLQQQQQPSIDQATFFAAATDCNDAIYMDELTDAGTLSPCSFGSFSSMDQSHFFQPQNMSWNDDLYTLYLDLVE